MLDGSQRVVDPDEVLPAVLVQDERVEVQPDSVARVGAQRPLQIHVGWIGRDGKAWRPDLPLFSHVDIKGFPHCKVGRAKGPKGSPGSVGQPEARGPPVARWTVEPGPQSLAIGPPNEDVYPLDRREKGSPVSALCFVV